MFCHLFRNDKVADSAITLIRNVSPHDHRYSHSHSTRRYSHSRSENRRTYRCPSYRQAAVAQITYNLYNFSIIFLLMVYHRCTPFPISHLPNQFFKLSTVGSPHDHRESQPHTTRRYPHSRSENRRTHRGPSDRQAARYELYHKFVLLHLSRQ